MSLTPDRSLLQAVWRAPSKDFCNKKIKSRTEKREHCEKPRGKKFRALLVGATRFQCLSLCLNLLTDICFVIFVPFWVGCVPLGRIRGKQRGADCCHCRLTARTVINNCVFLALFAMNYILSALQIYIYKYMWTIHIHTQIHAKILTESRGALSLAAARTKVLFCGQPSSQINHAIHA